MERQLDITSSRELRESVEGVKIFGNPDAWVLICKVSSKNQGWMKSTKAMNVPNGVLVQVTTEHRDHSEAVCACAEALTFVPGVTVEDLCSKD